MNKKGNLTLRERIDIERKYRYGESITNIAKSLGRNKSTISREINGKPPNVYRADVSHRKALKRISNRGNKSKLKKNDELLEYVKEKMILGWSPGQISLHLKIDFKKNKTMRISYEAIYQYIYSQINSNGKVKKNCKDLRIYLTRRRKRRMKKGFRQARKLYRTRLPSIEDRSKIVDKRKQGGHWEDNYLVSRLSKVCIKSVNERKTGIVLFGKTVNGTAKAGDDVLFDKLKVIPDQYLRTLTRDNGKENMNYLEVEDKLNLKVYFCHPYRSCERGFNAPQGHFLASLRAKL
jgi:IS30 family transposase